MPRTVTDIFMDNPVEFMNNNVVFTPEGGGLLQTGGVKHFTLTLSRSTAKSIDRPGATIKCYEAHPASKGGGNGIFLTYWCPYEEGKMCSTTVGNSANMMFTAPMNGCTFGVGSEASDGSRLVAHVNMKGQPDARNQQNKVLNVTKLNEAKVDPNVYMNISGDDPVMVTTFGVRDPRKKSWSFYYQLTTMATGMTLGKTLIGVFPIL